MCMEMQRVAFGTDASSLARAMAGASFPQARVDVAMGAGVSRRSAGACGASSHECAEPRCKR